jgi:hypothetical protein
MVGRNVDVGSGVSGTSGVPVGIEVETATVTGGVL